MILSIDPGLNHVGWALWDEDGRLDNAGLARSPGAYVHEPLMRRVAVVSTQLAENVLGACFYEGLERPVFEVVVEVPQIYRAARSRGDPNDLISIAVVAGAVSAHFQKASWHGVRPREWKGTLNGDKMAERIRGECSLIELGYFVSKVPKSLQHNVLDAIGLGRWWWKNRREKS